MRKIYFLNLTCILLVLGLIAGAQPAELLVHYKLDDGTGTIAADASGNGLDGTVNGAAASWVEGTLGGALQFAGAENVTLPAVAMSMTSNNGSVAFWIKMGTPEGDINTLFWAGDNTTGGGFGSENEMHVHVEEAVDNVWTGGELGFFVELGETDVHIFSDPAKGTTPGDPPVDPILMGDDEWHHVAASWGNSVVRLYIDGALIMEKPYTSTDFQLSNIFLGQMGNGGRTYTGIMDDVRIFTGVLQSFEVEDLFNKVSTTRDIKSSNNLSFYPNPASDVLNVRFVSESGKLAEVSLVNLVGQEVVTIPVSTNSGANDVALNLDGIVTGIYFIRLELDNEVIVGKVRIK